LSRRKSRVIIWEILRRLEMKGPIESYGEEKAILERRKK